MLLQQVAHYNDLSPKLRDELTEKIKSFGKNVRYKFNISNPNPDPEKYGGIEIIWPNVYTLDPTVFNINDPYEKRENKQRSKLIALVDGIDEKGLPNKFKKIRIEARFKGILSLDVEDNDDHFNYAMFLELHPKLVGGMFADKTKHQIITRIDERELAKDQRSIRTAKLKALNIAEQMSDKQVVEFADAMIWDSTEDIFLLRNKIEELAENTPEFFNDLVNSKNVEYQSVIQQALNKKIISFDPAEYKFTWTTNSQTIAILQPVGEKNHVEKMSEWMQTGGQKAEEFYKKLKSLLK